MKNVFNIFSSEDVECLKALIEKLEQSSFDYMRLENNGTSIVIGKNGVLDVEAPAAAACNNSPAAAPAPEAACRTDDVPTPEVQPQKNTAEDDGLVYLKCPSYGLFYAQPEPGAPAYIKVGDHINVGDTVCLIEIMKTYTAMTSNISGTVVEILVNNQDAVEPEQPLFAIRAD